MQGSATAHSNIALVKDWGKRDIDRNLPAVSSLAITRDAIWTSMAVGTMGVMIAFVLALIIGGVILLCFKLIKWEVPLSFIGTIFVITAIAHVVNPEIYHSPFVHIFSGGLLLGAFFMATDYVTSPVSPKGMLIFGTGCGLLTIIIRFWILAGMGVAIGVQPTFDDLHTVQIGPDRIPHGINQKRRCGTTCGQDQIAPIIVAGKADDFRDNICTSLFCKFVLFQ